MPQKHAHLVSRQWLKVGKYVFYSSILSPLSCSPIASPSTNTMTSVVKLLGPRHIQNFSEAETLQPHWGYVARALPCTNDIGSCEYLDTVYHSHDLSVLHTFILWAVLGGILLIWGFGRRLIPHRYAASSFKIEDAEGSTTKQPLLYRFGACVKATSRKYLLPESVRTIFGRTTRLNVLVLVILTGYLIIFTFVGIVYKTWITPVKKMPSVYNTRTGLGPWADRIGVMAYALTPLSILLSSRESVLSLVTGISYQHFNFLHRWLGYIIFIQAFMHTLGWTIVEARLYQPQPKVWDGFIGQKYIIWGIVAMILVTFLLVSSTQWCIRLTGYEFWRKSHYFVAMIYIGACWGHWNALYCWMAASLTVWFVDRGARLVRTALLHYNYLPGSTSSMGFRSAQANITYFPDEAHGDVVRLDFEHNQEAWNVGQHFFLCFPELSVFQAHPFTPLSLPRKGRHAQLHSYIMRAKNDETKKLAELARRKQMKQAPDKVSDNVNPSSTSVILAGPYGAPTTKSLETNPDTNILCIAGGTGISFVLPVLLSLISEPRMLRINRIIQLVWVVRKHSDIEWIREELDAINRSATTRVGVKLFVTREDDSLAARSARKSIPASEKELGGTPTSSSSLSGDAEKSFPQTNSAAIHNTTPETSMGRPHLSNLVKDFVSSTVTGPTCVYASGPGNMISDIRTAVASCNEPGKIWYGDERYDVQLINDDRLEW
jgi:NAD(P)H-flavin reductase/DMSO/TMAO reductase YedYZ heme-binding membrane subunit